MGLDGRLCGFTTDIEGRFPKILIIHWIFMGTDCMDYYNFNCSSVCAHWRRKYSYHIIRRGSSCFNTINSTTLLAIQTDLKLVVQ